MAGRPGPTAAALLLALAAAAAGQDAARRLEQVIGEIDRLREEGKLREAGERLASTVPLAKEGVPPALMRRLVLAQNALIVAAASAYGQGEECGFLPEADRKRGGGTPRELARGMFLELIVRLDRLQDPEAREAYLRDPAFAALRERPLARCVFASSWRRPHREVWPGVQVDTGDPMFDALFDFTAHLGLERPGEPSPAREWLAGAMQARNPPGATWAMTWRCALISPQDKGGLPVASPMLQQPELVAAARSQLRGAFGPAPWGFEALCLLNLAIAAGDHDDALALLGRLQRQGGMFYDMGVDKALALLQRLEANDARRALVDVLQAHAAGLPPPAAPPDAHLVELERLLAAGEVKKLRAWFEASQQRSRSKEIGPDLKSDLQAGELAAVSAVAQAYARGEDAGWYTPEQLAKPRFAGLSRPELAVQLLRPILFGLGGGRTPIAETRHMVTTDARLAPLMATPIMRTGAWSWGRPPAEVWPGLKVETGDARFDALFAQVAVLSPRPGALLRPVEEFVRRAPTGGMSPAQVWLYRWRCALLAPAGEGGWPTRLSLLNDPRAVREALRELEASSGAEPTGFQALARVNLHIALGEDERALALVNRLEQEGGFLYDLAVTKGLIMVQNVSGGDARTPLGDDLTARVCGVSRSKQQKKR